jgi:hypothetical protein
MNSTSGVTDPGTPPETYRAGVLAPLRRAALLLALAVAGALLAAVPLACSGWEWIVLLFYCPLLGLPLALCGALGCLNAVESIGMTVTVQGDELAVWRWWSARFYPWAKMTTLYNRGSHAHLGGKNRWPLGYGVRMEDGRRLSLDHVAGLERLGQAIEAATVNRLLARAIEQCRAGQTVYFGRLSVNAQGIVKGDFTLPWGEMTSHSFDGDGWLTIACQGKEWKDWIVVSPNKVYNLHVLLKLIEEFAGTTCQPSAAQG